MNRVEIAIANMRKRVDALDDESRTRLDRVNDLTFDDHFGYQSKQSIAHASGKLSTEEAQVIYMALGESLSPDNGGWSEGVDLATKIIITQIIGELLGVPVA